MDEDDVVVALDSEVSVVVEWESGGEVTEPEVS